MDRQMDGICSTGILEESPRSSGCLPFPRTVETGRSRRSHGEVEGWVQHGGEVVLPDLSFPTFPKAFTTGRPEEGESGDGKEGQPRSPGLTEQLAFPGWGRGSLPGQHVQRHRGELKSR